MRRLIDDDAALVKHEARRQAQLVGEDRELVRPARAPGILADDDLIVPLAFGLLIVWVVHGYGSPQPSAFVPVHGDRFAAEVGLRGKELHFEVHGRDHVLY